MYVIVGIAVAILGAIGLWFSHRRNLNIRAGLQGLADVYGGTVRRGGWLQHPICTFTYNNRPYAVTVHEEGDWGNFFEITCHMVTRCRVKITRQHLLGRLSRSLGLRQALVIDVPGSDRQVIVKTQDETCVRSWLQDERVGVTIATLMVDMHELSADGEHLVARKLFAFHMGRDDTEPTEVERWLTQLDLLAQSLARFGK